MRQTSVSTAIADSMRAAPQATLAGQFVSFRLARQLFALPLAEVERVVRMVAVSPVPEAPPWVAGVIDLHGRVLPVIDLRLRFGHTGLRNNPDDRLVVVQALAGTVALVVDEVHEVLEIPAHKLEEAPQALAGARALAGIIRRDQGITLVLDSGRLLPTEEDWSQAIALAGPELEEDTQSPDLPAGEAEAGSSEPPEEPPAPPSTAAPGPGPATGKQQDHTHDTADNDTASATPPAAVQPESAPVRGTTRTTGKRQPPARRRRKSTRAAQTKPEVPSDCQEGATGGSSEHLGDACD